MKLNIHSKYELLVILLFGAGNMLGIIAWFFQGAVKTGLVGISFLAFSGGLMICLVGTNTK